MDRSAIDTIRGYFYQFDYSIASLLALVSDNDTVVIEGLEDVDVNTANEVTAVQCKYFSKSEYNHSVIKGPVMYMLDHFAEVKRAKKQEVNYLLRGHYKSGHEKLNDDITVEFLKQNFLTYTRTEEIENKKIKATHYHHLELGLTDDDLAKFLSRLKIDLYAEDFDVQFNSIIKSISSIFNCSNFTSEYFYYNNALRVIRDLSVRISVSDRTITKKAFFEKINTGNVLFNEWFIRIKSKKVYLKQLRAEYFTQLNINPFERIFLVEISNKFYQRAELKELLFLISKKWSKLSRFDPKPFCPYIYFHLLDPLELVELKKELIREDFYFMDGFDYQGAHFNPMSITKKAEFANQIKIKIINSIYFIEPMLDAMNKTREIYQFYMTQPYFEISAPSIKHIKIQVEQISDIKNII